VKAAPRAAGAVVFRRSERGIRVLILRAYNNWDFPKGLVEPGEDELAAAKREVEEETGLADLEYPFGDEFKETVPYAGRKVARYYLAETGEVEL
jgi:8-oxo-dGTP pyrophosphatase MutT (NUDIX family)